jgi:manganese/iron transport system ATP-binding protein
MTPYQSGEVKVFDERVDSKSSAKLRLKIAHVFQLSDIDPKIPISVFETIIAGTYGKLGFWRHPGTREKALAEHALKQVGLLHLKDRPLGQLSGGECQRVAIARALCQEPELLLLDEPTASLDWQAQRDILELIRDLQKQFPVTVLMTTHDLNAVASIANQVAMLKAGKILWSGGVEDAMQAERLSALYDVPITVYQQGDRKVALF